jgi:Flp pilus assembly protein TadD
MTSQGHSSDGPLHGAVRAPDSPRAVETRGAYLHSQGIEAATAGDVGKALDLLSQAADADPQNPLYYVSLGRLLASVAMFNQAALAYLRAQELAPREPTILAELADSLQHLNRNQEAMAARAMAATLQQLQDPTSLGIL